MKDLGQIVATQAVCKLNINNVDFSAFVGGCLNRYLENDWGEISKEDREQNDNAEKSREDRILASYLFPMNANWNALNEWGKKENRLWIITERDHSVITILFPSEY